MKNRLFNQNTYMLIKNSNDSPFTNPVRLAMKSRFISVVKKINFSYKVVFSEVF